MKLKELLDLVIKVLRLEKKSKSIVKANSVVFLIFAFVRDIYLYIYSNI